VRERGEGRREGRRSIEGGLEQVLLELPEEKLQPVESLVSILDCGGALLDEGVPKSESKGQSPKLVWIQRGHMRDEVQKQWEVADGVVSQVGSRRAEQTPGIGEELAFRDSKPSKGFLRFAH
jgi:hypothetical protein